MFFIDFRLLFSGLLVLVAVVAVVSVGLERWRLRRKAMAYDLPEVRRLLEHAPVGLLALEKGRMTYRYANPRARRLLGLAAPAGSLPDAEWVSLLEADRKVVLREGHSKGRYRTVSLSSGETVRWWLGCLDDRLVVFVQDVTVQQRAEQAAGYLLSALAHELRTPIATILTHLEILQLPDISTETGRQSLHLLKTETQRMSRLVHSMLELGRLETSSEIERGPIALLGVAEQALAQMAAGAQERRIELALQADTPLPLVLGNADYLLQVFLNLLDNGCKYSRAGDRVEVSLRQGQDGVECTVHDTGPGIPAEHLPHVTRRFYRIDRRGSEGSGLGLALVKEILRRHHSSLEIESQTEGHGTGTWMWFVLPVATSEEDK
jgi:two-component system phosphate regulon sensor histidine kinase PhoR